MGISKRLIQLPDPKDGHGDMEIFTPAEVIEVFELSQINKAGAKWDMQKPPVV